MCSLAAGNGGFSPPRVGRRGAGEAGAGLGADRVCSAGRGAELGPEPLELSDSGDDAGWEDEDADTEPAHGRQHTPCLFCDRFVLVWEARCSTSEHVAGPRLRPARDG